MFIYNVNLCMYISNKMGYYSTVTDLLERSALRFFIINEWQCESSPNKSADAIKISHSIEVRNILKTIKKLITFI